MFGIIPSLLFFIKSGEGVFYLFLVTLEGYNPKVPFPNPAGQNNKQFKYKNYTYVLICSQEYTEMKLIVLGEDQRSVEVDTFRYNTIHTSFSLRLSSFVL